MNAILSGADDAKGRNKKPAQSNVAAAVHLPVASGWPGSPLCLRRRYSSRRRTGECVTA